MELVFSGSTPHLAPRPAGTGETATLRRDCGNVTQASDLNMQFWLLYEIGYTDTDRQTDGTKCIGWGICIRRW